MNKKQLVWNKLKLFVKELFNFVTNLIVPLISILTAIAEVLQLPIGFIKGLKTTEYWLFNFAATKPVIDNIIVVIDKEVEKNK